METLLSSQPSRLLNLPDELKLHIVNCLADRRDLFHLSQTCRVLEDMVMNRLYYSVNCELPTSGRASTSFRDPLTQSVRELTIRNGTVDRTKSIYGRKDWSSGGSVEGCVAELLQKIPAHQLTSFAFLHQSPVDRTTVDALTLRHGCSLRHLGVYDVSQWEDARLPVNLTSFEARTVNEGDAVQKVLSVNRNTLERLSLGQERHLIQHYRQSGAGFLNQIPQPPDFFFTSAYGLGGLPHLRDLSLHGLDVSRLSSASLPQTMLFCQLERLTLESCPGSAELLETIAATFHWTTTSPEAPQTPRITPSLKHLFFRHENPSEILKNALIRFLSSFTGLETLSMLFENGAILDRPATFICDHGPTLKTLAMESRIQPREHLSLDTSRPFGIGGYSHELWEESINEIARCCPNLTELGTGFPWNDELVRIRKTALITLQHLRIIHIRNFPETQVFSQLGDYSIKEFATRFVQWVFPSLVGGDRPPLAHLAVGPTLYETRWKTNLPSTSGGVRGGGGGGRATAPEFLRTHHFCVDWAKTRFGRWSPMITHVSESYVEEMTGQKPLTGVFEQVWLR